MALREYVCAECGGTFTHECRGRPRVCCEDCAPIRKARQIREWAKTPKAKAIHRAYYEANRERRKAAAVAWNRANPERRSATRRKHYRQPGMAEARAAYQREWREANPDKVQAYSLLHSGRRRGASGGTAIDREYVAVLRNDPCSYCGVFGAEIDHIEAVAANGSNDWTNLTSACRACNPSKRELPLLHYLIRRGGYHE